MLPANTNEMSPAISDLLLSSFSSFLTRKAGITFEKGRWRQFRKGIEAASLEFGFSDPANCIKWLMSSDLSREQLELLASHLTIIETYFFREKKSFDALENKILPQLIQTLPREKKRLRIWSAACSTGEEPYTISMILNKKKEALEDVSTLILATDINREALDKARKGIYREWSFRTISPSL
ncbi:MAG: chemotaxis protein CheR, partial [bacterium]|nr:chemotaxis protein CheR [bacterium]